MRGRTAVRAFGILGLLITVGCSSGVGIANDAATDVASADVATHDAASDLGAPSDAASPTLLDGAWRVTNIQCNGMPGSAQVQAYITAPNSSSFSVHGAASTYALVIGACTLQLNSTVTYPSAGRAVFTASGPFTCNVPACHPSCGVLPTIPYVFTYTLAAPTLTMTSVGPTDDTTCTATGQSNPITYTYVME